MNDQTCCSQPWGEGVGLAVEGSAGSSGLNMRHPVMMRLDQQERDELLRQANNFAEGLPPYQPNPKQRSDIRI